MNSGIFAQDLVTASYMRRLPNSERIGISLRADNVTDAVDKIALAANSGVRQVWFTSSGSMYRDTLTLIAVAASRVSGIRLGTSIVQAYTRHPVAMAQQVLAINDVAPSRFRLGIGVSHRPIIEEQYGIRMKEPLNFLREYITSLRGLLYDGGSEYKGDYFNLNIRTGQTAKVPILVAALGVKTFELAGEISDGAISWMCPPDYLVERASKAIENGAKKASREKPPLVAHVMIAVSEDSEKVMQAAEERVRQYSRMPFYHNMFRNAGYDPAKDPNAYRKLAEALTIHGSTDRIKEKVKNMLDKVDELLFMHIPVKDEKKEFSELLDLVRNL